MTPPAPPATAPQAPAGDRPPRTSQTDLAALADLAARAVVGVHGCDSAAVTLAGAGAPFTAAATSPQAHTMDQAQYRYGDGPCLTALRRDQTVLCQDYTTDQRWPDVAGRALAAGVRSSLSVPLRHQGAAVGALNLYSSTPRAFDAAARSTVTTLLERATLTLPVGQHLASGRAGERRLASASRDSLLPRALPSVPGLVAAARCLPSGQAGPVSGDWYDLFALPDGMIALAIGDVMGHDAAAAAQMGQLRAALRAYAFLGSRPSEVLDQLDALVQGLDLAPLATALYGRLILDQDGALLLYGNAGHPPPLLRCPDGTVTRLTGAASFLIGVPNSGLPARSEAAVHLPVGSTLLLYTDGLLETRLDGNRQDLDESLERLSRLVAALPTGTDPAALCEHVLDRLGASGHHDDITLLALQITSQDRG